MRGLARAKRIVGQCLRYASKPRMALFDAHRVIESQSARDRLADVAAAVLRWRAGALNGGGDVGASAAARDAERLRTDGLVRLPDMLSGVQIDEILRWLEGRTCTAPYQPERGPFSPAQPPPDVHIAEYDPGTIVAAPHLLAVANTPSVLRLAEVFLGAKPTISNLSLWWSFPQVSDAREAQLFHRDVDDLRFCKLFIYMSDVDQDSGPHVFVHGSPGSPACRPIRRYGDDEVRTAFGDAAIEYLCGHRGASFVANTLGVHKGLPPQRTKRLLFQVQYSLFPLMSLTYRPIPSPQVFPWDRYVNRLYVS